MRKSKFRRFETTAVLAIGIILGSAGAVRSVTLMAIDDSYGVHQGEPLSEEPFGVLNNDTVDGENAGEAGATVRWLPEV